MKSCETEKSTKHFIEKQDMATIAFGLGRDTDSVMGEGKNVHSNCCL